MARSTRSPWLAVPATPAPVPPPDIAIEWDIRPDGVLEVRETLALVPDQASRRILCASPPGSFPLAWRISDIKVTDFFGKPKGFTFRKRLRGYDCFIDIEDYGPRRDIKVSYQIHQLVKHQPQTGTSGFRRDLFQQYWNSSLKRIDLRVRDLNPAHEPLSEKSINLSFEITKETQLEQHVDTPAFRATLQAPDRIRIDDFIPVDLWSQDNFRPRTKHWDALVEVFIQGGGRLVLGLLAIAIALRALGNPGPIQLALRMIPWVVAGVCLHGLMIDIINFERDLHHGIPATVGLISLLEWVTSLGVLLLAVILLQKKRSDRALWFAGPGVLLVPLLREFLGVIFGNDGGAIGIPLLLASWLILWSAPINAAFHGVGLDRLLTILREKGTLPLSEFAARLRLEPGRLPDLLQRFPEAPVVLDFRQSRISDLQTAQLEAEHAYCRSCHGATELQGRDLRVCPYCGTQYAWAEQISPGQRDETHGGAPDPVQAASLALIGVASFPAAIAIEAVFGYLIKRTTGDSHFDTTFLIGELILIPTALLLVWGASALLEGRAEWLYRLTARLAPGIPAQSGLARAHFRGEKESKNIQAEIARRGELPLSEIRVLTRSSTEDAIEYALTLARKHELDIIYDRVRCRLIQRQAFEKIPRDQGCHHCGGLMGIIQGKARCQYCGKAA